MDSAHAYIYSTRPSRTNCPLFISAFLSSPPPQSQPIRDQLPATAETRGRRETRRKNNPLRRCGRGTSCTLLLSSTLHASGHSLALSVFLLVPVYLLSLPSHFFRC
ncbi:unnamed protein product [Caenorhabditis auriculariae]|uniref:Uncharacterized protein n=1 Tax=Caenorhabditis auriculariae TaxID=2777116 RepID=A0A8S1GSM6_9PELO|nr:unnamed protein product [Caenorhabditis auriculariae]